VLLDEDRRLAEQAEWLEQYAAAPRRLRRDALLEVMLVGVLHSVKHEIVHFRRILLRRRTRLGHNGRCGRGEQHDRGEHVR